VAIGQPAQHIRRRRPTAAMSHISLALIANALMFLPSIFEMTL
jgi:hypothetical protein